MLTPNANYKPPPPKPFLHFLLKAFKDASKIFQLAFTVISLGIRIKQERYDKVWSNSGIIFVALLVTVLSALAEFIQERQLAALWEKLRNNIKIDVVREGRRQKISISDVVVGEVVFLNTGDQIPADGLFIDGHSLSVDESGMASGKSKVVTIDAIKNPFLIGGSKVVRGNARMLVTSVGMSLESDGHDHCESTTLQSYFELLTSWIGKLACAVSLMDLLRILISIFSGNTEDGQNGIDIPLVTSNVAAIAKGLSLAFTVNLVYSIRRLMDDGAMILKLSACEAIGSTTVICTHKTGILTKNQPEVVRLWVGVDQMEDDSVIVVANDKVLRLFRQGVGLNTSGSVHRSVSGNNTEKAILSWGVNSLGVEMEDLKKDYAVLRGEIFSSEKMRSGVLIRKRDDNTIHVHWKGAPEVVLAMCSNCYLKTGIEKSLSHDEKTRIEKGIEKMAASGLRCIAFAHKQNEDGSKTLDEEGLTLLGIVGLEDPCKPGVKEDIETCRCAGVRVMMITRENRSMAKAIAMECGILEVGSDGIVVTGEEFRNYTKKERMKKVERIRVMARSSRSDKLLMVKCLKKKGHVVAVTTNNEPALKKADVRLSMGIKGTEVAKQGSDIVILDDSFHSMAMGLKWGRGVFNNIQKYIQFQLPANVATLFINFCTDASGKGFPLTSIHMLWVNLIMVALCSLTLAMEKPTKQLMKKKPPLGAGDALWITNVVWRNMLAQSMYQILVVLAFWFRGGYLFNVNDKVMNIVTFNTFVFCQLFNLINSRKLEKMNVFKGLNKNLTFLGAVGAVIGLQIVLVEFVLAIVADIEGLNMKEWGICIAFAALSWLIGLFVKFIAVTVIPFLCDIRWRRLAATTKQGAPETRLERFGDTYSKSSESESSSLDSRGYVTSRCIGVMPPVTYQWSAAKKYGDDPSTQINSGLYSSTRAFGHPDASSSSCPQNRDDVRIQIDDASEAEQERKRAEKGKGVIKDDGIDR